eukprot:gnl/MRDRNA2_/MRDRNA2_81288_c0_seq1.p1 gnl/MRDRNA2_/MRDRNA2_81288_c0~~gnl/MRDRNA2_/MRDRNA2_81288_c0_seq1.p1  ORF type:complete len:187 (-),score=35.39 gnl/MRDRNA2_/MRDRNA2_81288_c0_seq1:233-793(-)
MSLFLRTPATVTTRPCQNGLECASGEINEAENCVDDEFHKEKGMLKALVRSFAIEANSGLKCSIFEDHKCAVVPAKLFLHRSLTMILVHDGNKISIPLSDVVAAYSSGDLKECFPDSELLHKVSSVEDPGKAAFIHHQSPGVPESWVSLSFADQDSKERCIISINVLQKLAEMRQQRSREHLADFA